MSAGTITGTIAGVSIQGYVRSWRRRDSLCNPGQRCTLVLRPDWPGTAQPGQATTIYENGVKVLTGYSVHVERERPSYNWGIDIDDTYQRALNYFIDEQLFQERITTASYWIDNLLSKCGLSYSIVDVADHNVPEGTEFGLQTVHEAMQNVLPYVSGYIIINAGGVAEIRTVAVSASDVDWTYNTTDLLTIHRQTSDEYTRNYIKVFGASRLDSRGFITAFKRRGVHGIDPDRVAVIGSGLIETTEEADRVATYLLNELAQKSNVVTFTAVANPNVRVGDVVRVKSTTYNGIDYITNIETSSDEKGYIQSITIGERCPRIAGFSTRTANVYAGTASNGVYKSFNQGYDWSAYNTGLPFTGKSVTRIAANFADEAMVLLSNNAIYYAPSGGAWELVELPAATGQTSGSTPVAIDSGGPGFFGVLITDSGSGSYKTWLYTTGGTFNNLSSDWTATQMTNDLGGTTIRGFDLSMATGANYVIATSSGSN